MRDQLPAIYCLPQSTTLGVFLGFHYKLLCKFLGTPGHQDWVTYDIMVKKTHVAFSEAVKVCSSPQEGSPW